MAKGLLERLRGARRIELYAALALVCAWSLWLRPASTAASPAATPRPSQDDGPSAMPSQGEAGADAQTGASLSETSARGGESDSKVSTIVYYQDNYGYLVPVMCSVPMEDGIAKATLNLMIQSVGNAGGACVISISSVSS